MKSSLGAITALCVLTTHMVHVEAATGFVQAQGTNFVVDGQFRRFAGTNNYYLLYDDKFMVDNVLETAAIQGFEVVRTWAFIDIGLPNGSGSITPPPNGMQLPARRPQQLLLMIQSKCRPLHTILEQCHECTSSKRYYFGAN
jgi:hypothetical protein